MKGIILAVVGATLLAAGLAYKANRATVAPAAKPVGSGYTLFFIDTENGKLIANVRRLVRGNRDWLQITDHLNPDGSVKQTTKVAGTSATGAVTVNDTNQTLTYMGRAQSVHATTEAEQKASPTYLRDDYLLGLHCIVQGQCYSKGDAKNCAEFWIAPELANDALKVVHYDSSGNRVTREAVSIVMGEPSFQVPNYATVRSSLLPPVK